MRISVLACLSFALVLPALAQDSGQELDRRIASCSTYAACLRLLDNNERVARAHAQNFAEHFLPFGERAKRELVRRASVPEGPADDKAEKRREAADSVLRYWPDWTGADIPTLEKIVREHHESQLGWVLAKIGTPESIRALTTAYNWQAGEEAGNAILSLGDIAIPFILDGMSGPCCSNLGNLIRTMEGSAARHVRGWAEAALDSRQTSEVRISSLRALREARANADPVVDSLYPLLDDPDPIIQIEAVRVLHVKRSRAIVGPLVNACPLMKDAFTSSRDIFYEWNECVEEIASYGADARAHGAQIAAKFLASPNGADRSEGATAIGYIGYAAATPKLVELLDDPDWRVVYASIRALGWLGAKEAIPQLQRIAGRHWLPGVGDFAREVAAVLQSPDGMLQRPREWAFGLDRGLYRTASAHFEIDSSVLVAGECPSGRWKWGNGVFTKPSARRFSDVSEFAGVRFRQGTSGILSSLPLQGRNGLPSGYLIGTDVGEWGGDVYWKPRSGDALVIYDTNVAAIESSSDGAVAVLQHWGGGWAMSAAEISTNKDTVLISNGPSGIGFAIHLTRDASGKWQMTEIARFPQGEVSVRVIGNDLYAAWSAGYAVVFDTNRILGRAACIGG